MPSAKAGRDARPFSTGSIRGKFAARMAIEGPVPFAPSSATFCGQRGHRGKTGTKADISERFCCRGYRLAAVSSKSVGRGAEQIVSSYLRERQLSYFSPQLKHVENLVSNSKHWGLWINKFAQSVSLADLGNTSAQSRPLDRLDLVYSRLQLLEDGGEFFDI